MSDAVVKKLLCKIFHDEEFMNKVLNKFNANETLKKLGGLSSIPEYYRKYLSEVETGYGYTIEYGLDIEDVELFLPGAQNFTKPTENPVWSKMLFNDNNNDLSKLGISKLVMTTDNAISAKKENTIPEPNNDWRGVHPVDFLIPWMTSVELENPSIEDIYKSAILLKSHKSENNYEMFFTGEDNVNIEKINGVWTVVFTVDYGS